MLIRVEHLRQRRRLSLSIRFLRSSPSPERTMAPSHQSHPSPLTTGPPSKRARHNPIEPLPTLENITDSLTHPSTATRINALLSDTPLPNRTETDPYIRSLKSCLDQLPKKGKVVRLDSAYLRNTLRKSASGVTISSLFKSPNYEALSVTCKPPKSVHIVGSYLLGFSTTVDIAIELPESVLNEKDYLNHSYHDKRLLYLIYLTRNLSTKYKTSFLQSPVPGSPSKPSLTVTPLNNERIKLRLLPYTKLFPSSKLAPNRRNIRPAGESSTPEDISLSTPAYNASILLDSSMLQTLQAFHNTASSTPAFIETIQLLHAWAKRHHLPKFPLTALLHDLLSSSLPRRAPREQLLRATLAAVRSRRLEQLQISEVPIAATLPKGVLQRYSSAAATALRLIELNTSIEDPWYGILPQLFTAARGKGTPPKPLCTLFDGFINLPHPRAEEILTQALVETGRITSIEPISPGFFGVTVSSYETACRRVDSRPDNIPAEKFKSFWGDVASLRRFRDGRVIESILWDGGVHAIREIISYAVKRHLGDIEVSVVMGDLEDATGVTKIDAAAARSVPAFDELATILRRLEGLPLSIRAVQATSPYLRRCGAFVIRPSEETRFVQPLDIVASFESSSAWPDDPVALSAAKAAFYLAVKTKLSGQGIVAHATISFLDITLAGLVFRLRIRVDRERQWIENQDDVQRLIWTTETLVRHHENIRGVRSPIMGRVTRMVKRWLNSHMLLSQLGSRGEELVEVIVADMFSRRDVPVPKSPFRGFCQVLRQLAEFPWEVCPLAVFLNGNDDDEADMDTEDGREAERAEFLTSAQKQFAQKPGHLAVYCDRDGNGEAVTWFDKPYAPEAVIVSRIRETAKASLAFIERFAKEPIGCMETVCQPPTTGFDMVIHLHKETLPYRPESVKGPLKTRRRTEETLLAGFDPVQRLMDELIAGLGKYALFLMSINGGCEIFVLLRPTTRKRVPFSLREAPYRKPCDETNGVELAFSTAEFVAEIERIGGQLVDSVELIGAHKEMCDL